jgi:RimJ/RimL family protein N-acetyltransferase
MNNPKLPTIIETNRTYIRNVQPSDGKFIYDAVVESYEQFKTWLPWVNSNLTLETCEKSCCDAYQQFLNNDEFRGIIFLKNNHQCIGSIGLHNIRWEIGQFEIGYWCRKSLQGKGFIIETVSALVSYVIANYEAKRIFLTTDERNIASQKIAEKTGFLYEGTLHFDRLDNEGKLRNTKIFAIWDFDDFLLRNDKLDL